MKKDILAGLLILLLKAAVLATLLTVYTGVIWLAGDELNVHQLLALPSFSLKQCLGLAGLLALLRADLTGKIVDDTINRLAAFVLGIDLPYRTIRRRTRRAARRTLRQIP